MPDNRYTSAHWGSYRFQGAGSDLRLVPLADDPAPSVIGAGWLAAARDTNARILAPVVRKGWLENRDRQRSGDDGFVEVSWDEALDLAAGELDRVRRERGNAAIFGGSYGWASAGRFHHAQSQLHRFLNTIGGYVSSANTYSHAAAEVLFPYVTGLSNEEFLNRMTSWSSVAEHCQLLVSFGGLSGRTAQIASGGTSSHEVEAWLARARANGAEFVNVSPLRSDMADAHEATQLAIRPNTDTALMLGLAHCLVEQNLCDRAFLERYTSGWPRFERYLTGAADGTPKSAEWAASICDIEADRIRALARRMATRKTMIAMTWGIQRADHGEQPLWMGITLAAMLGQIGRPGTGFGFGYGSTAPIGRPAKLIARPSLPQGRNPVADFIPVARIADMLLSPGGTYTFDGETRTYPDIRLVYWAGGNPFHHHQDLFRLQKAWSRPETIIVNDIWWTATARRADIVFPATSSFERTDIMMSRRDPTLIFMEKQLEPLGQARNDFDIFRGLAQRLGTRDVFTDGRDEDQWLRHLWDRAGERSRQHGVVLPDFDAFRAMGRFDTPDANEERILFDAFVADPGGNPLQTPSGRIEIYSETIAGFGLCDCPGHPTWIAPAEWLGQKGGGAFPLHLISNQPLTRLHGQLDNGPVSGAAKIAGREPVRIHPQTARQAGIEENDIVLLSSPRGRCLAAATLTDGIRPDTVALATGAWFDPQILDGQETEVHGNPNALTLDKGCSGLSQGNIAHTTMVAIEKWNGPLPGISVHSQPRIEQR